MWHRLLDGSHRAIAERIHLLAALGSDLKRLTRLTCRLHQAAGTRARCWHRCCHRVLRFLWDICRDYTLALLCCDSTLIQLNYRRLVSFKFVRLDITRL